MKFTDDWFMKLDNKQSVSFTTFDIIDFYPSISEKLLLCWPNYAAGQFTEISDKRIIVHARRTLLFDKETLWEKRNNSAQFDVSMGSYDGAEICDLVGLYMLHMLDQRFNNNKHTGLYRVDGLAVIRNMGPRTVEKK